MNEISNQAKLAWKDMTGMEWEPGVAWFDDTRQFIGSYAWARGFDAGRQLPIYIDTLHIDILHAGTLTASSDVPSVERGE